MVIVDTIDYIYIILLFISLTASLPEWSKGNDLRSFIHSYACVRTAQFAFLFKLLIYKFQFSITNNKIDKL